MVFISLSPKGILLFLKKLVKLSEIFNGTTLLYGIKDSISKQ
jgi:hypothetical protein